MPVSCDTFRIVYCFIIVNCHLHVTCMFDYPLRGLTYGPGNPPIYYALFVCTLQVASLESAVGVAVSPACAQVVQNVR